MGKRSRESLGETPAQAYDGENSKKRRKDGSSSDKKNKKTKRLRELRKDIVDLPEEDVEEAVAEPVANGDSAPANGEPEVLSKKAEKKRRKKEQAEKEANETGIQAGRSKEEQEEQKEKKKQQKTEEAATTDETKEQKKDSNGDTTKAVADEEEEEEEEDGKDGKQSKAPRFIVFVGNLPYSATAASIKAHFASLNPAQVRCLTMRDDPTKCRGCAFIDFSSSNDMRTCLDKMHHSTFNDGISKSRKINVELTAGGGGKTSHRMDKIKKKNEKLNVNRLKRIEQEKEEKKHKTQDNNSHGDIENSMHPSRRARVPGL
ncbi:unnamed protein product [Parascedosporium putredinis]|uniref:RRM domain-containing protein n=1 Tax=Parascedosporium putredinis TaxID=1442378 RepID=A0A9P1M7C9_9PEZI|nr:unnamed protein product [Parascedosporium putredinis]CAI7988061.1 unnamed protein product [Parascedosporium putredinis]